jgi:hypothetical protein
MVSPSYVLQSLQSLNLAFTLGLELNSKAKALLIDFPALSWAKAEGGGAVGRVKKQVSGDGRAIRVLEVSPRWKELGWCTNAHVGYVTSGKLRLEFADQESMEVSRGQGFWIPRGCAHKASCERKTILFIVD